MKQEKAKMRRIGGFLLEVLILVFVFSYSNAWADKQEEEHTSASHNIPAAQFLLGDFNIPASKEDLGKITVAAIETFQIDLTPPQTPITVDIDNLVVFSRINFYYSLTTINAP